MDNTGSIDRPFDLVVLCGPPGVGKLTVARELASRSGYALFHNHLVVDTVMALFPFGSPAFVQLRESLWLEILTRAARERVGGVIFTYAFDRTVDSNLMFKLQKAVAGPGCRVSWVEIVCDEVALQRRIASTERQRYNKLSSLPQYLALRRDGAFPRIEYPAPPLVVETTHKTAADAAMQIAADLALPFTR